MSTLGQNWSVPAEEIKKALRLKAAFSDMLDQMQWLSISTILSTSC